MKRSSNISMWAISCALSLSMGLCSCSEESTEPQDTGGGGGSNNSESADSFPSPSDGDAVLVAVNSNSVTETPIGPIVTVIGTAVSIFTDDGFASGDFISAGEVSCNDQALAINPNNSYTFTDISVSNPTGLDFSSGVNWEVTGANGIMGFTHDASSLGFPSVGEITSAETVDRSQDYTLTCASVAGADSVIFLVGGVAKTLQGNTTSCTFTSDDISDIATGINVAQVAAYVISPETYGGKQIYFVNETVQSETITVE